jgi:2-keto-4-pentenoate hydratase
VNAIDQAAARLAQARRSGTPCAPVRDLIGEISQDDAYSVQEQYVASEEAAGSRIVGRKIGLTSQAVQQQFGVAQPDFGVLFDHMIYGSTEPIELGLFLQPRVEGEIAFVLSRDLDSPTTNVADVLQATGYRDRRFTHCRLGHSYRRHNRRQRLQWRSRAGNDAVLAHRARSR